jgi:glycosyltransferase involved in cell wall biosynthesis
LSLAIVIPVYNEGNNITPTLNSIFKHIKSEKHIYIVYDFEEDTTLSALKGNTYQNLTLMRNKYGRGVLNAIKTGLEDTKEDAVLVTMADGSDEYQDIDSMYQKINEGYGIVVGSRYMKGGQQLGGPFLKSLMSRVAGVSAFYLTGIPTHDISNSFRMYSRKVLNAVKIESTGGFELGMEITVKAFIAGFKIAEVPTTWHDRCTGRSNFKLWKWLPSYLRWYFYLLRNRYFGGK